MEYSILAVLCLSIVVFAAADPQNQASEEQRRIALGAYEAYEGLVNEKPDGFLVEIKNTAVVDDELYFENCCTSTNVTDTVGSAFSGKYEGIARSEAQQARVEFINRFGECDCSVEPRCDSMYVQEDCGADIFAHGTCYTAFLNVSGWCLFHKEQSLLICSEDKVAEWPWNVTNFSAYGDMILWDSNC
eukprot:GHVS01069487.1.p1 GENE.GHVS01069487.1~~GHVS01069487.1.p1  ORF type:complete len:188 (+),score=13.35 GHVS01069487.1:160-723(+)